MSRPLALFDIGGTMLSGSDIALIDAHIADRIFKPNFKGKAQDILGRYTNRALFYEAMVRELMTAYAEGLQGARVDKLKTSTSRFFKEADFFGYVKPTIDLLAPTHEVVLVTGASQFTAEAVAGLFGIHRYISTQLGVSHGILTGQVESYMATSDEKGNAVVDLTNIQSDTEPDLPMFTLAGSFGFGDSEGDSQILYAVEHPICVQPTDDLAAIAKKEGWEIVDSRNVLAARTGLEVVRLALAKQTLN